MNENPENGRVSRRTKLAAVLRHPLNSRKRKQFRQQAEMAPSSVSAPPPQLPSILDLYVTDAPSAEAPFGIFKGEWSSAVPGIGSGHAGLFDDDRIKWLSQRCGAFSGKTVLELGPLEGGHTYMIARERAKRIVAIESNTRAFMKCLVVKNAFGFDADFRLGDFRPYLQTTSDKFDFVLACGVLYHMMEPERLLADISRISPRLGLWTHYYDEDVIKSRDDLRMKFSNKPEIVRFSGLEIQKYPQRYLQALEWKGFCGGTMEGSRWLSRESLVALLTKLGYRLTIGAEDRNHPNGPCVLMYCEKD